MLDVASPNSPEKGGKEIDDMVKQFQTQNDLAKSRRQTGSTGSDLDSNSAEVIRRHNSSHGSTSSMHRVSFSDRNSKSFGIDDYCISLPEDETWLVKPFKCKKSDSSFPYPPPIRLWMREVFDNPVSPLHSLGNELLHHINTIAMHSGNYEGSLFMTNSESVPSLSSYHVATYNQKSYENDRLSRSGHNSTNKLYIRKAPSVSPPSKATYGGDSHDDLRDSFGDLHDVQVIARMQEDNLKAQVAAMGKLHGGSQTSLGGGSQGENRSASVSPRNSQVFLNKSLPQPPPSLMGTFTRNKDFHSGEHGGSKLRPQHSFRQIMNSNPQLGSNIGQPQPSLLPPTRGRIIKLPVKGDPNHLDMNLTYSNSPNNHKSQEELHSKSNSRTNLNHSSSLSGQSLLQKPTYYRE